MKVQLFRAENFMRLKEVSIDTEGRQVVVIRGKNEAGKTSVWKAIQSLIHGKRELPDEPIRRGEKEGWVYAEFGGLRVSQTLVRSGDTYRRKIKLERVDGKSISRPQQFLSSLAGRIQGVKPIDPEMFGRLSETPEGRRQQRHILIKATGRGEHYASLALHRKKAYTDRTFEGRKLKELEGQLAEAHVDEGEVPEFIETAPLTERIKAIQNRRLQLTEQEGELKETRATIAVMYETVHKLQQEMENIKAEYDRKNTRIANLEDKADGLEKGVTEKDILQSTDALEQEVCEALRSNTARGKMLAEREKFREKKERFVESQRVCDGLTERMDRIDKEVIASLKEDKMPVDEIALTEDGLLYDGLPFEQLAESKRLEIGFDIAVAMLPEEGLRIVPIEHWDSLDTSKKRLLMRKAEEASVQIWAQSVGDAKDGALYIEDGTLVNAEVGPARPDYIVSDDGKYDDSGLTPEKFVEAGKSETLTEGESTPIF